MNMWILCILCYSCIFTECWAFLKPNVREYPIGNNPGSAAFVTPLIEKGRIKEAQQLCNVPLVKGNITSYAGFFTIKKEFNSNMFFWFFPSRSGPESSPVVLWLQGGPGATSLYGLFEENGPIYVLPNGGLKLRKYSWIDSVSVLYIDNPVGTGFSFTDKDEGYAKSENDIADNLLIAMTQFFLLFPNQRKNNFFISGESYGGKYVPALAYRIDQYNSVKRSKKINLIGITIGNGFSDPENMMAHGKFLYEIGLIDNNGLSEFQKYENEIVNLIQKKLYKQAFDKFDMLLNGDLTPYKSLFYNLTGFTNYFNYRFPTDNSLHGDFSKYVQSDVGRRVIHVGNYTFHTDNKVEQFLINDVMQSVKPIIEFLLGKKYKVLIYNGQLDIIVAYPLTVQFINNLNWYGKSKLANATRHTFMVGSDIAGYYRTVDNFVEMMIRDAGHMVPRDQPLWALELITRYTNNKPF